MEKNSQEPVKLSLQAKIILFLWKWLGVWVALAAFVWGYAGFIWLTKERLSDPYLRSRMFIFAKLMDATSSPRSPEELTILLSHAIDDKSWTNSKVEFPTNLSYHLPGETEQQGIIATLSTISSNKPSSYDFTEAVKKL